jgi:Protein kinase domain/WD40-like Beta Propeller Repeat
VRGSRKHSGLEAIANAGLYNKVAELFAAAMDVPPHERVALLEKRYGGDRDLLAVVLDLVEEDGRAAIVAPPEALPRAAIALDEHLLPGRVLSHYRILGPLAAGGMGTVFRALDTRLERVVALKFLPQSLTHDPASRERFVREALAIASIDHPNVCPVYEFEEADGYVFIAMAYLDGVTLAERSGKGPLAVPYALDIALQAARGLHAAHSKGIIHRDIKPANLMLTDAGLSRVLVRILDFGIAQWTAKSRLTGTGLTLGTIAYMAPEQVSGSRVDEGADIWSLGVVLYEMLLGRLPFEGESTPEILSAIAGPRPANLSPIRRTVSGELIAILSKALEKDPAKRYRKMSKLVADLERIHSENDREVRFWSRKKVLLALAGLLVAAGTAALLAIRTTHRVELKSERVVPLTFYPGCHEQPAISPDGKLVAFVGQGKDAAGPFEVYVQLVDSTEPLRLTHVAPTEADRSPAWNPSATRIAFLRTQAGKRLASILTIPAIGGPETNLGVDGVDASGRLAWNPNGRTLAFSRLDSAGQTAIFEIRLDNHVLQQRSFPSPGQDDCCPQYDPTGRRLAFTRNEVEITVAGSDREPEH